MRKGGDPVTLGGTGSESTRAERCGGIGETFRFRQWEKPFFWESTERALGSPWGCFWVEGNNIGLAYG